MPLTIMPGHEIRVYFTLTRRILQTLALSLCLLSSGTTMAAECKGMKKSKCENASQCTYVKGYTTKSGTKVSAYCRNKGKSSSKSSSKKSQSSSQNR